ncbi:hypothetical protein Nepgr_021505 [Nepenthes gracilis]|uniref:RAB6-interacting golgin n=1 Tax=Nepenthes gracilis TaxID=150966 RepID=A0AAD3XX34_NEPGR|nr:hypothetical protein Nepgr_021505 [Nepenthes gracilis]
MNMAADSVNPSLKPEIGPDGLPREAPVIAYTEKIIEEEKLQLKKYIEENYSKIRDVERELANLSLELKLTAGSKNAAFEHLRRKIEIQNEKVRAAKLKEEQARKVWEASSKAVQDEEAVKQKLCDDLSQLVQESSNSQYARLEELKRRMEALNPGRASTCAPSEGNPVVTVTAGSSSVPSMAPGNNGNVPATDGQNQQPAVDGEGRGKKKSLLQGRGKGLGALPKGRLATSSGWTGAGFDSDGRS